MISATKTRPPGFTRFLLAVPWPYHLALAAAAYLLLQALAARVLPLPGPGPDETALYAHRLLWKSAATLLQYLLPGAFGLAAFASFRRGRDRPHH